jgi:hypothetical protein
MRNQRKAGVKSWVTGRTRDAFRKAHEAEAANKRALKAGCEERGWRVACFEGKTGAPRTGIIDAVAFRLDRKNCDVLQIRLIQLKGGTAGVSGRKIARLKQAATDAKVAWRIAAFDGEAPRVVPNESL